VNFLVIPRTESADMQSAYLVCYDIADPKRWRLVHKIMLGNGDPLQLSVFLCVLTRKQRQILTGRLREVMHHGEDALAIIDLGPADTAEERITTFGKVHLEAGKRHVVV
jgi:CRISPR-associated protein Cas2